MDRAGLEGIAAADVHLGRRVPLPTIALPLARWVDVHALGPGCVEIAWNLDDTRAHTPGRLALYAGTTPAPDRALADATAIGRYTHRTAPLEEADASLQPVQELAWTDDGLYLRLTAQGPWELATLQAIADSVA